ncbi:hypothetical protein [Acinetobacter baumannii]|uniref:hypothetical protein n=1 Tax=Acinetobacter baumannii TaxID=470 RepID=UPI00111E0369|nr:hypothetical protein [Acinetobacter baumannii]
MDKFEEYYKNSEWFGTYESDLMMKEAFEAGQQSQQAKVEELEGKLKQAYEDVDTFAEAHERECGFKAQLAKDKAELQKRVDAALKETQFALQYVEDDMRGNHEFLQMAMIRTFKALEQALKGDQYDEHHKKAEEAISKGASLTNHRIEL